MKIVGSITDHDRLNTLYMLTVSSLDDCKEKRWTEAPWHCWTYKEKKTDHVTQIHFFACIISLSQRFIITQRFLLKITSNYMLPYPELKLFSDFRGKSAPKRPGPVPIHVYHYIGWNEFSWHRAMLRRRIHGDNKDSHVMFDVVTKSGH